MKRPVIATLLLSAALFIPGCPIYDDDGCQTDAQCAPGYVCQLRTGECVAPYDPTPECDKPSDCPPGWTCDRHGQCRSADCSWADVGCVDGYVCTRDQGVWRCLPEGPSPGSGGSGGSAGSSSGTAGAGQGGSAGEPVSAGGAGGAPGGQGGEVGGAGAPTTTGGSGACECEPVAGGGGACSCE
jgi:hypothetical protein